VRGNFSHIYQETFMKRTLAVAAALAAAGFAARAEDGAPVQPAPAAAVAAPLQLAQADADSAQARRRWNAANEADHAARRRWNAAQEDEHHARRRWNAANPPPPESRPHRPELTRPMVQRLGGGAGGGDAGRRR
jgi:hypothetical protein